MKRIILCIIILTIPLLTSCHNVKTKTPNQIRQDMEELNDIRFSKYPQKEKKQLKKNESK